MLLEHSSTEQVDEGGVLDADNVAKEFLPQRNGWNSLCYANFFLFSVNSSLVNKQQTETTWQDLDSKIWICHTGDAEADLCYNWHK